MVGRLRCHGRGWPLATAVAVIFVSLRCLQSVPRAGCVELLPVEPSFLAAETPTRGGSHQPADDESLAPPRAAGGAAFDEAQAALAELQEVGARQQELVRRISSRAEAAAALGDDAGAEAGRAKARRLTELGTQLEAHLAQLGGNIGAAARLGGLSSPGPQRSSRPHDAAGDTAGFAVGGLAGAVTNAARRAPGMLQLGLLSRDESQSKPPAAAPAAAGVESISAEPEPAAAPAAEFIPLDVGGPPAAPRQPPRSSSLKAVLAGGLLPMTESAWEELGSESKVRRFCRAFPIAFGAALMLLLSWRIIHQGEAVKRTGKR